MTGTAGKPEWPDYQNDKMTGTTGWTEWLDDRNDQIIGMTGMSGMTGMTEKTGRPKWLDDQNDQMTGITGWPELPDDRNDRLTGMTGMTGMAGMTAMTIRLWGSPWPELLDVGWGHLYSNLLNLQQRTVQVQRYRKLTSFVILQSCILKFPWNFSSGGQCFIPSTEGNSLWI
jgi:hypothetical protein